MQKQPRAVHFSLVVVALLFAFLTLYSPVYAFTGMGGVTPGGPGDGCGGGCGSGVSDPSGPSQGSGASTGDGSGSQGSSGPADSAPGVAVSDNSGQQVAAGVGDPGNANDAGTGMFYDHFTGYPVPAAQVHVYTNANQIPNLTRTLQVGARDNTTGGEVTKLQRFLSSYFKVAKANIVSGYYGITTRYYVMQFQRLQGLEQTGSTGPLTRARINAEFQKAFTSTTQQTNIPAQTTSNPTPTNVSCTLDGKNVPHGTVVVGWRTVTTSMGTACSPPGTSLHERCFEWRQCVR